MTVLTKQCFRLACFRSTVTVPKATTILEQFSRQVLSDTAHEIARSPVCFLAAIVTVPCMKAIHNLSRYLFIKLIQVAKRVQFRRTDESLIMYYTLFHYVQTCICIGNVRLKRSVSVQHHKSSFIYVSVEVCLSKFNNPQGLVLPFYKF